jgi:hypothetical protein
VEPAQRLRFWLCRDRLGSVAVSRSGKPPRQRGRAAQTENDVAADFIPTVLEQLNGLTVAGALYLSLLAVVVLTALYSKQPDRRERALKVLALLLPGRRQLGRDDPPGHAHDPQRPT